MATDFKVKIGEIDLLTYIRRLDIPKRSEISQYRFQKFTVDDSATSRKNLVNFGPATLAE